MLKITHVTITLCILLVVSFAANLAHPVQAVLIRVPGVTAGNWAKYAVAFNYSTNDPNPSIPKPPDVDQIQYAKITVTSVVGTNVTLETIIHFVNGTEISNVGWTDVTSGYMGGFLIVAANLTAGDALYDSSYSPVINGTAIRTYAGADRTVNYIQMIQNYTSYGLRASQNVIYYWDKLSGILTEGIFDVTYTRIPEGYETRMFEHILMTETNIWSAAFRIPAEVRILPGFLNLNSMGMAIMALVELPEGFNARNIDVSTIRLNETIPAEPMRFKITLDFDRDGKKELLVRFSRAAVETFLLKQGGSGRMLQWVTLTLTGKLRDGTTFGGSDKIIVFYPIRGHFFLPFF